MFASRFGRIVSSLAFIVLMTGVTHACYCGRTSTSDCQSFSNAETVFTGKLVKIEKEVLEGRRLVHAFFEPSEIFKGDQVRKTEKLTFGDGDCLTPFELGVEYVVFQEFGPIQSICNRTRRASDMKATRDFLTRVVNRPKEARIVAVLQGLSDEELRQSEFYVGMRKTTLAQLTPYFGTLIFTTSERAKHRIKMIFPVTASIDVEDGLVILTETVKVTSGKDRTIVEYDVDVGTNPCDTRIITITKR